METKYYVPKIEEFHVGFEFEYFKDSQPVDNEHITFTAHGQYPLEIIEDWIYKKEIRVKYLDRQDIEECGWHSTDEENVYISQTYSDHEGVEFYHRMRRFEDNKLINLITVYKNSDRESLKIIGFIKCLNKSELKKIMEMVSIK